MISSFAEFSTIISHLNWSAAVIVNLVVFPFSYYIFLISASAIWKKIKTDKSISLKEKTRVHNNAYEFIFVIPAHNEEVGICETIQSCRNIDSIASSFRVVVIADNCTDQTAKFARDAGAEVFERFDAEKKSKGYALEWYFDRVRQSESNAYNKVANSEELKAREPCQRAFVIVDADSIVSKNMLNEFTKDLEDGKDWIQCRYDVRNPESSEQTRLLTYALSLFNGVWLWGQDALGMGCALRGNGMCFREEALKRFPWKAYGLTEDLEFSWLLRLAGEKVSFNDKAVVYGEMVSERGRVAENQRQRWEDGRKSLRRIFHMQIWRSPYLSFLLKVLSVIDLFSFPLAKLTTYACIGGILGLAHAANVFVSKSVSDFLTMGIAWENLGLILAIANILFIFFYLASPFILFNLPRTYLKALLHAPSYILWKYVVRMRKKIRKEKNKETDWIRTERERR